MEKEIIYSGCCLFEVFALFFVSNTSNLLNTGKRLLFFCYSCFFYNLFLHMLYGICQEQILSVLTSPSSHSDSQKYLGLDKL